MAIVRNTIKFSSGGGTDITVVANYSALPDPTTVSGQFYWCSASQGTSWLPGSLGGTYYNSGLYYSNGTTWEFLNVPFNATQSEVNTGTNNDKFVTPNTLKNQNYLATIAYADAKVENAIVDGVTDKAPSQNAVFDALSLKANLSSPTFTGTPLAPTASLGNNTTQLATTAFVKNAVDNASSTLKTLSADVTTTLNTAQTISGLTQALEINSTYIIRGNLRNGCSGTGGVKFAISYPTSTIAVVQAVGQLASINSATWNIHGNAISGVLQNAVSTFAGNSGTYNVQGTIKTGGTAGNLTFSFASTTAGQTSTIFTDGTYIEIIKIA